MVRSFHFTRLPAIYFGQGKISVLIDKIRDFGDNMLLVTGKRSFLSSVTGSELFERLKGEDFRIHHCIISGEPSPGSVDEAVADIQDDIPDVVVAIGGGSVLDAGKAISAMLGIGYPLKEYLEGVGTRKHPGTRRPFIAVPTTSGTGSEATSNAVISETGREGFKKSLRHDNFVPDIAIVDPALTLNCPPDITAASGMDCFTQLTEAFLSDKSSAYTDALALEGLRVVRDSLVKAYNDGSDIDARSGMSFAALTSGICLANAGLGIVHGYASSLGGRYDIPHGVICGTLMASANEINVRELRRRDVNPAALKKYALLGRIFLDKKGEDDEYYTDGFIEYLHDLTHQLHLKGLSELGVRENDVDNICDLTGIKNNPVSLFKDEIKEILLSRM